MASLAFLSTFYKYPLLTKWLLCLISYQNSETDNLMDPAHFIFSYQTVYQLPPPGHLCTREQNGQIWLLIYLLLMVQRHRKDYNPTIALSSYQAWSMGGVLGRFQVAAFPHH